MQLQQVYFFCCYAYGGYNFFVILALILYSHCFVNIHIYRYVHCICGTKINKSTDVQTPRFPLWYQKTVPPWLKSSGMVSEHHQYPGTLIFILVPLRASSYIYLRCNFQCLSLGALLVKKNLTMLYGASMTLENVPT